MRLQIFLYLGIITGSCACGEKHYSTNDFYKIHKIDTHIHLNSANPALAKQAQEDNFKILAVNVDIENYYPPLEKQLEYALNQQKLFPKNLDILTAFTLKNWKSESWEQETIKKLKSDFSKGALGIKIWKNIGMEYRDSDNKLIMIDNPKFDKIIDYVISQDKTVMGHLAEPKNCWLPLDSMTILTDAEYYKEFPQYHMYLHPEFPSYEQQIKARDNFIERHPKMRFVGAHLGSLEWNVDELSKRLDKYPNMAVDLAARICHLQYQSLKNYNKVREFIIKYQDRIIYGSDSDIESDNRANEAKTNLHEVWQTDWKYFVSDEKMTSKKLKGTYQGLWLPQEVVDKIFYQNAVKWFKM